LLKDLHDGDLADLYSYLATFAARTASLEKALDDKPLDGDDDDGEEL
jgi:hypothetical protein